LAIGHFCSSYSSHHNTTKRLCDEGAGSGGLVSPGWWESADGLVVAGETVDTGLDENQAELSILVFAVSALEMLADGDGLFIILASCPFTKKLKENVKPYLLDQHVKILWNLWCKT
jgi:hypothetical protein